MNTDNPITNEAEAWAVLAELIAGAEALPAGGLFPAGVPGLCRTIYLGNVAGVFSEATVDAMYNRIRRALKPRALWLCRQYHWRPRVAWCRRFARQAARECV